MEESLFLDRSGEMGVVVVGGGGCDGEERAGV